MKSSLATSILVLNLLIAPASYAQSSDGTAPDEQATIADPTPPASTPVDGLAYLRMADNMPFGLWEVRFSETLRQNRLGVVTPAETREQLRELDTAARVVASGLQQLTPPAQMVRSHELNISAAVEYSAAFESSLDFMNGDDDASSAVDAHFKQAREFATEARRQLR